MKAAVGVQTEEAEQASGGRGGETGRHPGEEGCLLEVVASSRLASFQEARETRAYSRAAVCANSGDSQGTFEVLCRVEQLFVLTLGDVSGEVRLKRSVRLCLISNLEKCVPVISVSGWGDVMVEERNAECVLCHLSLRVVPRLLVRSHTLSDFHGRGQPPLAAGSGSAPGD